MPADSTNAFFELNNDKLILIQSSNILCLVQNDVIFPIISKDVFLTFLFISFVNETIAINNSKVILISLKLIIFIESFFLLFDLL